MCRFLIILILFFSCSIGMRAQETIQMEKDGGVYKIPCVVNGLKLKLIFDTGAASVCISQSVAMMMLENDYLSIDDIKGTAQSQVADGRIVDHTIINLKKIQIGNKTLTNVDAVVIHGQVAPLLLGQSALKRLGRYSISGDKLIFGVENATIQQTQRNLSEEEIDRLFEEAEEAYINETYHIALEKYRILDDNDLLSAYGKMEYADCYYYTGNEENAVNIYLSIQDEIEKDFPQHRVEFYYQLGRGLWGLEDFDAAIPYLEKVKLYSTPWSNIQSRSISVLCNIYDKKGDEYKSRRMIEDYIRQYLEFMEIKATDCWNKHYVDKFLADLYYQRYLHTTLETADVGKYITIAAAWGSEKAIEYCKKYELDYSTKSYNYEY